MQPSDFLAPFGRGSGSPRLPAYLAAGACSWPRRACPSGRAARSETDHRPSAAPDSHEERQGTSRVTGPSSSCAPWSNTPPDMSSPCPTSLEKIWRGHRRFQEQRDPQHPGRENFRGRNPTAHTARVPDASPVPLPTPSQGSLPAQAGSPLAGRDSHPLDDESKFQGVIAFLPFPSTSIAWSHPCIFPSMRRPTVSSEVSLLLFLPSDRRGGRESMNRVLRKLPPGFHSHSSRARVGAGA